jgi:hypothetical protein
MGGQRACIGDWQGQGSVGWPRMEASPILNPPEKRYMPLPKGRAELSTISDRSTRHTGAREGGSIEEG